MWDFGWDVPTQIVPGPNPPQVGAASGAGGYWVYDAGKIKWINADGTINKVVADYPSLPYFDMARDAAGDLEPGGFGGWLDGWKGFIANFASWWFGYSTAKVVTIGLLGGPQSAGGSAALSPAQAIEGALDAGAAAALSSISYGISASLQLYQWIYGEDMNTWISFFGGFGTGSASSFNMYNNARPEFRLPTGEELAREGIEGTTNRTAEAVARDFFEAFEDYIVDPIESFFTGDGLRKLGLGPVFIQP